MTRPPYVGIPIILQPLGHTSRILNSEARREESGVNPYDLSCTLCSETAVRAAQSYEKRERDQPRDSQHAARTPTTCRDAATLL